MTLCQPGGFESSKRSIKCERLSSLYRMTRGRWRILTWSNPCRAWLNRFFGISGRVWLSQELPGLLPGITHLRLRYHPMRCDPFVTSL